MLKKTLHPDTPMNTLLSDVQNSNDEIDFVITWVDGSDPAWLKEKNKHLGTKKSRDEIADDAHRFRDWDNLQYLFRSIETYTPWVRKVHFVTAGHVPSWLNLKSDKLNLVKHTDYIPVEYLPTFNSCPIELNLHRIKGLSEKFVLFNDDTFITQPMKREDFFKDGLPRDRAILSTITSSNNEDIFPHILLNHAAVLNKNFNFRSVLHREPSNWLSHHYALKPLFKSVLLMGNSKLPGLHWAHLPSALLKSTFEEVWSKEPKLMNETSHHKFRDIGDVSQYLMKGWQILSGKFYPTDFYKTSRNFYNPSKQKNELYQAIRQQKYKMICINDTEECVDFEATRNGLNASFEAILPNRSAFEIKRD